MGVVSTNQFYYRGVPKDLILLLRDKFNITDFIETGTYLGDTAIWAAKEFRRVVTFEAAKEIYEEVAKKNLPSNMLAIFGNSSELIYDFIKKDTIFYLDAHFSSGNTFNSYPLLEEINQINKNENNDFIIIDDARFVLSKWNDERYCTIQELLNVLALKKRYTVVFDDLIISVPMYAKEILDYFTNENSKIYWQKFIEGPSKTKMEIFKNMVPKFIKELIKRTF